MSELREKSLPAEPVDLETSAIEVARELLDVVGDMMLDLDLPWTTARAIFAQSMFERARHRYGAMPRVAAALDTALRTVRRHVGAGSPKSIPTAASYNTRWRVLAALNGGPRTLEQIRRSVPRAADVDLAAQALESLVAAGDVALEPRSGLYRRTDRPTGPSQPVVSRSQPIRPRVDAMSKLFARDEDARRNSTALSGIDSLPAQMQEEFAEDLSSTIEAFEKRWAERILAHTPDEPGDAT